MEHPMESAATAAAAAASAPPAPESGGVGARAASEKEAESMPLPLGSKGMPAAATAKAAEGGASAGSGDAAAAAEAAFVRATQETLGTWIKKPRMTLQSLRKPTFPFLHAVITEVHKRTEFGQGLFTPEEMDVANFKTKPQKVAFIQKAVSLVCVAGAKKLDISADNIVTGSEPEKTNAWLVMLYDAARNCSREKSLEAVRDILGREPEAQNKESNEPEQDAAGSEVQKKESADNKVQGSAAYVIDIIGTAAIWASLGGLPPGCFVGKVFVGLAVSAVVGVNAYSSGLFGPGPIEQKKVVKGKIVGGAYAFWFNERQEEFKAQCAGQGGIAIRQLAGREWKKLTPEEKAPYERMFDEANGTKRKARISAASHSKRAKKAGA